MKLNISIPEAYNEQAKTEFQKIINQLESDIAVKEVDTSALNQLGMCLHIYYEAQAQLLQGAIFKKGRGVGVVKTSLALKVLNEQNAKITRYYLEFGMTPSSRLRQGKELDEEPTALDLMLAEMKKN